MPKPSATVNLVTCISLDERGAAPDSAPDELFLRFGLAGFRRYGFWSPWPSPAAKRCRVMARDSYAERRRSFLV